MGSCQSKLNKEHHDVRTKRVYINEMDVSRSYTPNIEDMESLDYSENIPYRLRLRHDRSEIIYHIREKGLLSDEYISLLSEFLDEVEFDLDEIITNECDIDDLIFGNITKQHIHIPSYAISDLRIVIKETIENMYKLQNRSMRVSYSTMTNNAESTMNVDDIRMWPRPFSSGSSCRMYKGVIAPFAQLIALKVASRLNNTNVKQILNEYQQQQQHTLPECAELMRIHGWYRDLHSNEVVVCLEYMDMGSIYDSCLCSENNNDNNICNSGHKQIIHKLSYHQIQIIAKRILVGLHTLHTNSPPLIHCDIKPQNILLSSCGCVKIADFGLLTAINNAHHKGTTKYFSPERIAGSLGPWCDIWSFGITLIEIYNQKLIAPEMLDCFQIANGLDLNELLGINSDRNCIPNEFVDFVQHCLLYDYKQRASAHSLLNHPFLSNVDADNIENVAFRIQQNNDKLQLLEMLLMWFEEWIRSDVENNVKFFLDYCLNQFVANISKYCNLPYEIWTNILIVYIQTIQIEEDPNVYNTSIIMPVIKNLLRYVER